MQLQSIIVILHQNICLLVLICKKTCNLTSNIYIRYAIYLLSNNKEYISLESQTIGIQLFIGTILFLWAFVFIFIFIIFILLWLSLIRHNLCSHFREIATTMDLQKYRLLSSPSKSITFNLILQSITKILIAKGLCSKK